MQDTPKPPKGATLLNPGACSECGRRRFARLVLSLDTTAHEVYCPEHSRPIASRRSVVVAMSLVEDGIKLWTRPGTVADHRLVSAIRSALVTLDRAKHERERAIERRAAGKWCLIVEAGGVFAPRPLGDLRGGQWPMVAARLGTSRHARSCVVCDGAVANRAFVYRASASLYRDANYAERGRWSSSDIRDCIACVPCVDIARAEHARAGDMAANILAELIGGPS